MDPKQKKLLDLADDIDLGNLTLREISARIGLIPEKPQLVKHHIEQLIKNGFLERDLLSSTIRKKKQRNNDFIALPILGSVNCGTATLFAEENITGYIQVSPSTLPHGIGKGAFIVRARGDSMNRAKIGAEHLSIEDGDYVVLDNAKCNPRNKDYILSVIDGLANIKKYIDDRKKHCQIVLESESTKYYPPIFIHQEDADIYKVCGTVVKVIKKPENQ